MSYKIIVADDEFYIRKKLLKIIDYVGLQLELAGDFENGQGVLDYLSGHHADIVLLDIRMPGLSGIELIRTAREQGFAGEFILLTAHADFDYAHDAIRYGVVDYLLKPVDEDELLRAVLEAEKRIMATSVLDLYGSQSLSTMRSALFERALAGNLDNIALRLSLNEGDPCRLHQVSFLQQVICGRRSNGLTDHAAQVQLRIGKHGCVQRVNI